MADNAVAAGINPPQAPNTMGMLSSVLGIQQQRQQLNLQAQELQRSQIETQQNQGVNDFFSSWDPGSHHGDDGTLDIDSAHQSQAYQSLPGVARIAVDAKLNTLRGQQLQNKSELAKLNDDVLNRYGRTAQAISMHPDQAQSLIQGFKSMGPDEARIAGKWDQVLAQTPTAKLPDVARAIAAQTTDIVNNRPKAGAIETPTNIYPTTTAPETGIQKPTGQNIPKPLGAQAITYPSGQVGTIGGPSSGGALSAGFFSPQAAAATTGGRGAPQTPVTPPSGKLQPMQRPGMNAPRADQENYQRQIQQSGDHFTAVQTAANDPMNGVQPTRFRNQQILDLIPHANTGPGTKVLNAIASRIPGSTGDAYQDIEHYTAQNSAALAKTMGVPGTNLGAETAAAAAGSVERNPGALAEITKTNDALNTALSLYNRGLAKATNNGSDMSKVNSYRQAFSSSLDINAVRWADAHRRNDNTEIKMLQNKYGDAGVAGFKQKLATLQSLAQKGDLP